MSDDRIGVDYGSADYVGDVWHDDHADGTDGRRRRLLCGNSAVRGTRRRIKKPEKKGAEPTKVPAPKKNYYAFSIRREKRKSND